MKWLTTLTDPVPILAPISEAKVTQWANEARRLKARSCANMWHPDDMHWCSRDCAWLEAAYSMTDRDAGANIGIRRRIS